MAAVAEAPLDLSKSAHTANDTHVPINPRVVSSPRDAVRTSSPSSDNASDCDSGYGNRVDQGSGLPCFPGQRLPDVAQFAQDNGPSGEEDRKDFPRHPAFATSSPQHTTLPASTSPHLGAIDSSASSKDGARPFKMYPMDTYSMYNYPSPIQSSNMVSPMALGGMPSSMLSPTQNMDNGFTPLTLTPLTSHLLNRRRRADRTNRTESSAKKATVPVAEDKKDPSYWDRRRKNNDAAKRSRDARRCKEEEIAMRAAFLEQENLKLKAQVAILKNETAKLHYMLYSRV